MARNTLGGRYRILGMIGRGGFGSVYKARDERFPSKPIVAIKETNDAQLSPSEKVRALQDFRNEADLLVQLKHPNLPNVSDVFEEDGKAYLVMDFIEGKTLAQVQDEQNDPLDERLVISWALQLCTVLHYLHTQPQPIIFRDIKPANIMVTDDGEIKLIDFGIARIFKVTVKKDTTRLGSQGYAPPEQYGRGQTDARSDIYALGATLYNLLTKEPPADAPSRHMSPTLFLPPSQLNPNISPSVEAVILKAMAEAPQDRYQTALDMHCAIVAAGLEGISDTLSPMTGPFVTSPLSQSTSSPTNSPTASPPRVSAQNNAMLATLDQPQVSSGELIKGIGRGVQNTRRSFVFGGVAVAGAAIIGGTAFFIISSNKKGEIHHDAGNMLNLSFIYSSEKQDWMQEVINDFNQSNTQVGNKIIQIQGASRGSGDATSRILSGELKPVAWSPASDLELNQLINGWSKQHGNQDIVSTSGDMATRALVLSPLVFAAWKERADLLKAKYGSIDWPCVHDALQLSDWGGIPGGQASWGPVKFGQTRPDTSNSGLLSITLLAYSFYSKTSRLLSVDKIQNTDFLTYFTRVEDYVSKFGNNSDNYIEYEVIVQGPSKYDIVTTYESLVLMLQKTAKQLQHQPLILSYPSLNIVSNHPFAIFTNASPEEQMAAQKFRDFLLDVPAQRKALLFGFRSTNPNVSLQDAIPGNPFTDASLGFQVPNQLPSQVQAPSGDVTDALLNQWLVRYKTASPV